jgi:hypothetical protein
MFLTICLLVPLLRIRKFSKASIDDLKEFSAKRTVFEKNCFYSVFFTLTGAIASRPGHVPGTAQYAVIFPLPAKKSGTRMLLEVFHLICLK